MKNRSKSDQKPPRSLPVLTEVVHVTSSLEQETVPGALMQHITQETTPAPTPAPLHESPIAQAVAKLTAQEPAPPPPPPAAPVAAQATAFDHYIPQTASGFASSWWTDANAITQPAEASTELNEEKIIKQVLDNLEQQVSAVFEQRVHEVVGPALLRLTDALMAELRHQLTLSLRDMVTRAIALEMARQHTP